LKKELEIPEGYKHVCAIALGYSDEARMLRLQNLVEKT
jgi:hypothetical protein